jgi:hypothetical protein
LKFGGNAVNVLATQLIDTITLARKYKTNIRDVVDDPEVIYRLRPAAFNWKKTKIFSFFFIQNPLSKGFYYTSCSCKLQWKVKKVKL